MRETNPLWTVGDVAKRLNVSRSSVYRRVQSGELEAFKVGRGGDLRFREDAVEKLLQPAKEPSP
jgi:excisionase family DNA binding protein